MKKTLSIFVMLTMVSSVVLAGGIDNPNASSKVAIMKKDADHIQLYYKSTKATSIEVLIYDAENKLKFSETIRKSEGFTRPYDLSNMKRGEYTIVVNDGDDRFVEKINTLPKKSSLLTNVIKTKTSGDYVLTIADDQAKSVSIKITDRFNNVLFQQNENIDKQLAKMFHVSTEASGVKFSITNDQGESILIEK